MNITFRTDASLLIGTGHVMRCLTLADALRAAGSRCHFICRELPGNLIAQITQRSFTVSVLAAPAEPSITNGSAVETKSNYIYSTSSWHEGKSRSKAWNSIKLGYFPLRKLCTGP